MTAANIDFSGHAAEMAALSRDEAEEMASPEYLAVLKSELAEEKARLEAGQGAEPDMFAGLFDVSPEGWRAARMAAIDGLTRAIARHPLA